MVPPLGRNVNSDTLQQCFMMCIQNPSIWIPEQSTVEQMSKDMQVSIVHSCKHAAVSVQIYFISECWQPYFKLTDHKGTCNPEL
jgi:hypothetical protein